MKVLQVNAYETPGKRFHGLAITPLLAQYGIESKHLVWEKDTQNPEVLTFEGKWVHHMNHLVNRIEQRFSLQSMLHINGSQMLKMPAFKEADLIHLHIIHAGYFSLRDLAKITAQKPTVWTIHDCWALTGHCVHPGDCQRWQIGCGQCPNLTSNFPLLKDNTQYLFEYKRRCYQKANFELIVASKWMHDKVAASPLFDGVNTYHIPFGLDLNIFHPDAGINIRKRLNIASETIVICFRARLGPFKGFSYIIEALKQIETTQKICLLTLDGQGLLNYFLNQFQIIELGWHPNDDTLVSEVIAASNIFLMPSMAEAFGMMAVEAMACGTPIIVFEGTALPEVTFSPEVGISVPKQDVAALAQALQRLIDNPTERAERGKKGRLIAEKYYSQELHVQRLVDVYKSKVKG